MNQVLLAPSYLFSISFNNCFIVVYSVGILLLALGISAIYNRD